MVGDRSFEEKKAVYKRYGHFILTRSIPESISVGKNTKYSRRDRRLKHFSKWSPSSIDKRTDNLMSLANDLWRLP